MLKIDEIWEVVDEHTIGGTKEYKIKNFHDARICYIRWYVFLTKPVLGGYYKISGRGYVRITNEEMNELFEVLSRTPVKEDNRARTAGEYRYAPKGQIVMCSKGHIVGHYSADTGPIGVLNRDNITFYKELKEGKCGRCGSEIVEPKWAERD